MYKYIKLLTTAFSLVLIGTLNGQHCNVYQTALDTTIIETISPFYNYKDHQYNWDKQPRNVIIYVSPAIKDFDSVDMNVWFLAQIGDSSKADNQGYQSFAPPCDLIPIDTNYILTTDFTYYETVRQKSDNFQISVDGKYYLGISVMFSELILVDDTYYGYVTRKLGPDIKFYLFKLQKTKSGFEFINFVSISDS